MYVSPAGSDENSGTSPEDPLRTINLALIVLTADSLNPRTIHVAPGIYSPSTTGEDFPLYGRSYVSIIGVDAKTTILDAEYKSRVIKYLFNEKSVLRNLTIQHGYASETPFMGIGGGIYVFRIGDILLKDLIIKNNRAVWSGGGIRLSGRDAELQNVLIHHNELDSSISYRGGAGLYLSGHVKLVGVTISDNIVRSAAPGSESAGGLFIARSRDKGISIINSVTRNNLPQNIQLRFNDKAVITNSNIEGGEVGIIKNEGSIVNWLTGNIDTNPLFLGGNPFDYRLSKSSTCIDAGTAFFEWEGDTLLNLSPDQYLGSAPDMGAFEFNPATEIGSKDKIPIEFKLEQNYPNPFNPTTTIQYFLPKSCSVHLAIYDVIGRKVAVLVDGQRETGAHRITWDGKDSKGLNLASGIYFYKLKGDGYEEVKKLLFVR